MAYRTFPANIHKWMNAKEYGEELENPALEMQMEAGYTVTRPKFTRKPRRTFDVTLNSINQELKEELSTFWNDVKGSSDAFFWNDPTVENDTLLVRFSKGPLQMNYKGAGPTRLWDVKFKLEEV